MATVNFREYYDGLSNKQKKEFRKRLVRESDLSESGFYVKLRQGRWRKLERGLIAYLIGLPEEEIDFEKLF